MKDTNDNNRSIHPSFGMISIIKHNKQNDDLFGSDLNHETSISILLKQGLKSRSCGNDWFYSTGKTLYEVEMTTSQFYELITSLNTEGVPCTIRINNKENIEGLPHINKEIIWNSEIEELYDKMNEQLKEIEEDIYELCNKTTTKKSDKINLLNKARQIRNNFQENKDFMISEIKEEISKDLNDGKIEFESFRNTVMNEANLEILKIMEQNKKDLINKGKQNLIKNNEEKNN